MSDIRGAIVEIIERRKKPLDSLNDSIVVPTTVRVNGAEIALPAGYPIKVHDLSNNDCAMVTLTVFAQRIFVGREYLDADVAESVTAAQRALEDAQHAAFESASRSSAAIEAAQRQLAAAQQELWTSTREAAE